MERALAFGVSAVLSESGTRAAEIGWMERERERERDVERERDRGR
jgi:hypothetical protein